MTYTMKLQQLSRTAYRRVSRQSRLTQHNTARFATNSMPSLGLATGDRDGIPTSVFAAAFAATAMLIVTTNSSINQNHLTTFCEDSSTTSDKSTNGSNDEVDKQSNELQFWPNGVTEDDLNDLVEEMLKDPTLNLSLIPDALERRIYKSTIQLTFNAFYACLSYINGLPFLSHEIRCTRTTITHDQRERTKAFLAGQPKNVNVEILAQVADRMLANPVINSSILPDAIERQVYVNCMIVIFRVLSIIFSSFRVTVCGHDFSLTLEPHQFEDAAMNVAVAHSSLSQIDMDRLKDFAEACGVPEARSESMTEGWSFWDRMWNRQEFMVQLHSSLYGLVLGILDDVLANTKIRVLSDTVALDIVPSTRTDFQPKESEGDNDEASNLSGSQKEDKQSDMPVGIFATATFLAGLGIGMTISTAINNQR